MLYRQWNEVEVESNNANMITYKYDIHVLVLYMYLLFKIFEQTFGKIACIEGLYNMTNVSFRRSPEVI